MERVIGIDLGTTFSAVAHIDEATQKAEIIPDTEQNRLTPSVVLFEDEDNVIVGKIAKQNAVAEAGRVVEFVKREMGKPKGEPPEGWSFKYGGRSYSAQEISAYILKKLKQDAEERLGETVRKAVITVPAYFQEKQRASTAEAGRIAGLEVLAILDEPVAAAIAYSNGRPESDENVFVFDLGGGTFDVTIISIKDGQIVPSAIRGDSRLGGKDWDDRIISYCAGQFQEQFGCNPLDDLRSYQDLQLQSIRAKEELSRRNRSRIPIHHEGHALTVELTREKFEELTLDLVDKCRGLCELALNEAGQTWADIDKILLVGGSTRMPMIVNLVRDISGKEPSMELHPDECVVQGAAWYALNRQEAGTGESPSTLRVKNITSHNLGVIALDEEGRERSFLQIPKGTPVPCEHRDDSFVTASDNATRVVIGVTEGGLYLDGNNCDRADCAVLGEVIIEGIDPGPKGRPIEVTMRFNENKTLEVEGKDLLSGQSARTTIKYPGGLTEEELEEATTLVQRTNVSG